MRLRAVDDLLSLSVATPAEGQALAEVLRSSGRWIEVVGGMDSVVVRFDTAAMDAVTATAALQQAVVGGVSAPEDIDETIEIPVAYGGEAGPDLQVLCETLGMTEAEIIALHAGGDYRVEMLGFTPGFAFIGGLDERLHVPRRSEPRQDVPPGSVGIAGAYTGIYALGSPGGWTLIGRTSLPLFNANSDRPFALRAGMRVRFRPVQGTASRQ